MNITTLINALRDGIKNNAPLAAWCVATYAKSHTVYKGMDARNPPPETSYPLVHIFPIRKTAGYELASEDHGIGVTCGVFDSTVTISGIVSEYGGIDNLEAFRKLVETAVVAAIPTGSRIDLLTIEYETIEFFPFLLASMEFKIADDYSQGDDVFK